MGYAPVSNVRLDKTEHLLSGLGDLDEDTVVDLQEAEELQDLAGLGRNLVDTSQWSAQQDEKPEITTHPRIRTTK